MVKRLVPLITLLILLVAAKENEGNNESEEDILEAIGSAAATLGHHVHRFFSAFVRGIEKELAERRRKHNEEGDTSKGAGSTPSSKGEEQTPSNSSDSNQEGSQNSTSSQQDPQEPQELQLPQEPQQLQKTLPLLPKLL
ncbi:uncharacterized protein LOC119165732 [Rhipicephalus microplus]|uniref:uncharacterized protein LOC119165732 n=1 Tax=Rhipicephalus microplus TaxID=6941 RepID=UPI003F6CF847